ncbi:MAG TPA: L,D-transpeptidase family protein [Gammaproteobacteria bacterium]|nr:L,D-transpeptidase family protein [Gammaproteobacteria bacterium]
MQKIIYLIPFLTFLLSAKALMLELPPNPEDDVVGYNFDIEAEKGDTLWKIGYAYNIGLSEIKLANPQLKNKYGNYKLNVGDIVHIPQQFILPIEVYREGIVINMAERRLYYFPSHEDVVYTYPVAMGKQSTRTPTMDATVKKKKVGPYWYPPDSIRMAHFDSTGDILPEFVRPGPNNPLGTHAIYTSKPKYLIHGNNNITSVGKFVSSGCIRMYNEDVEELHAMVSVSEPIRIIHHTTKIGTLNGTLYVETHPEVVIYERPNYLNTVYIDDLLDEFNGEYQIDYERLQDIRNNPDGVPVTISQYEVDDYYWSYEEPEQEVNYIVISNNQPYESPYRYKHR